MKQDLTYGIDVRGDEALFIEEKHFIDAGWELDDEAYTQLEDCSPTFFRVIKDGEEQSGHGWIEKGEIVQWGWLM